MRKNYKIWAVLGLAAVLGGCTGEQQPTQDTAEINIGQEEDGTNGNGNGNGTDNIEKSINIGLVMSPSGPGDRSLNDATFAGILQAQIEYGISFSMLQPTNVADFEIQLHSLAREGVYDLIFMVGGSADQTSALFNVATTYPDQKFSQIDSTIELPNVSGVQTRWNENMFLTGVMAGLGTKSDMPFAKPESNKVAILIGEDIPLMDKAMIGFEAGARLVNSEAEVFADFIGSFADARRAEEMAIEMFEKGVDFIQVIGGGAGVGIYMAGSEADAYVFAAGANVNFMAPNNIIATAYRDVSGIILNEISDFVNGRWEAGLHISGLESGTIGYDRFQSRVEVDEEIEMTIERIKELVISGELTVPETREELEQWLNETEIDELLADI